MYVGPARAKTVLVRQNGSKINQSPKASVQNSAWAEPACLAIFIEFVGVISEEIFLG
jgi:hypothetical protein